MAEIARLSTRDADFDARLARLTAFDAAQDETVDRTVAEILAAVKSRGDAAVLEYTARFDGVARAERWPSSNCRANRSRARATRCRRRSARRWSRRRARAHLPREAAGAVLEYTEADGTVLGQKVTPLDRVGLYVPGGKAAYPSSVLMNALPAKVAGVAELIMVVPTPGGEKNQLVLAAAAIAGVDRVFTIGGAQAVGALAYGTETIAQVDKIVGPGNAYVAAAKRRVFGVVGIDMVAGPSEILVICDGTADPDWIAMDLFSQAEHDEAGAGHPALPGRRLSSKRWRRASPDCCRRCRGAR